jgi:hypothetical protein
LTSAVASLAGFSLEAVHRPNGASTGMGAGPGVATFLSKKKRKIVLILFSWTNKDFY